MLDLSGKSAVVTGAASGIGRATAELLAECGASVLVADLNIKGAQEVVAAIAKGGHTADAFEVDVSSETLVEQMIARARDTWGALDILVNCAALTNTDFMARDGRIADLDVETWDRTIAVDARGVMLGCKHAVRVMVPQGSGTIVNISSSRSIVGALKQTSYGAAKAAVNSITRDVATQYGKLGIRCNAILPGPIKTPSLANNVGEFEQQVLLESVLTPYIGDPIDIAYAVAFLCAPWSRFITGEEIRVNGGRTVHTASYSPIWNEQPGKATH